VSDELVDAFQDLMRVSASRVAGFLVGYWSRAGWYARVDCLDPDVDLALGDTASGALRAAARQMQSTVERHGDEPRSLMDVEGLECGLFRLAGLADDRQFGELELAFRPAREGASVGVWSVMFEAGDVRDGRVDTTGETAAQALDAAYEAATSQRVDPP
jgi:hypothetical protein